MHQEEKRSRFIDITVFVLLLAAVSAITLILFYRQATGGETGYFSDMKAYILEMQGLDSGYSFPYPVFFKLSAFIHLFMGPELAVACATMLLNSLSIAVTKAAFHHLALKKLQRAFPGRSWAAGVLLSAAAVSLYFVSMVYPPQGVYLPGIRDIYRGVFTPNPFHNATYMAARPFALLAFLWYARLLPVYEQGYGGSWRRTQRGPGMADYVMFSLFLLLATMTKPSFTIVLVGTAGLIMVYRLIKSRFRTLMPAIQLGICFLPTFAHLLYQYQGVFVPEPGQEGGIGFGLARVWSLYCGNIPLALGLAAGFPLLVLALNFRELRRDGIFRFSWQVYLMSAAMALLLFEKGFREPDFNFAWGYMHGIFFAFFGALLVLLRATGGFREAVGRKKFLLVLQWLAYGWHLACGLYYFWRIFQGAMYY